MAAQYLIRLDDACPTMRREAWDLLEEAFDHFSIHPIVGVVPDNNDPKLICMSPDPDFWERVRAWERKGWGIALHGLHHAYHDAPPGARSLLPVHGKSEFVGLPLNRQRELIRQSCAIFAQEHVTPTMFMAPSHSFDANTLSALELESDIRFITDGHALAPYRDGSFVWIPQQLWHFRPLPTGVWSVCLHPNNMNRTEVDAFIKDLSRYRHAIINPASIKLGSIRERSALDRLTAIFYLAALRLKRALST